ncbi:MAG: membrane dipeptidase [Myxococcaceae bacterium]|nr:membrane dipeptidase [Myxococcaceae bacterium]
MTALGVVLTLALGSEPNRLTVDTHLHVTMARQVFFFSGEPGSRTLTWSTRPKTTNQVDGDQMLSSGGQLALATIFPPVRLRPGRTSHDEALYQLWQVRKFCREQPQFACVGTAAEARAAIRKGRIALLPSLEGGEGIDSAADVDRVYAAGARSVTLVHFATTHLGGAAADQHTYNVFSKVTGVLNPTGLTETGREVVERMFQLGMIVDLSHASDETSRGVLELAEKHGVPVINSHGGARAFLGMERNIPDDLAARIAKGGGMVGMTASDHQVAQVPDTVKWEGYVPGTCDDTIAHWKHLADVVTPERVTLGSDFNGMIARPRPGGECPDGIRNTGDLNALYDGLVKHGIPKEAIDGMGWRFLEMWEVLEQRADPAALGEAKAADPRPNSAFNVAM